MILGAGVAGLQAIATARRLGAKVEAFDPRPAVKEQVKSLGAQFIDMEISENVETTGGYAKEQSEAFLLDSERVEVRRTLIIFCGANQRDGQRIERVRHGGPLRYGCHRQLECNGNADDQAHGDSANQQIITMHAKRQKRRDHGDEHAAGAGPISPARGFDLAHPFLRMKLFLACAITISAATTETEEIALVSDIKGVCSNLETWRISSNPKKLDIRKIRRLTMISFGVISVGITLPRLLFQLLIEAKNLIISRHYCKNKSRPLVILQTGE